MQLPCPGSWVGISCWSVNDDMATRPLGALSSNSSSARFVEIELSRLSIQHSETHLQLRVSAFENTTSISVPERAPVLMWNCARLASTRALVSERLTGEPSEASSEGGRLRNGSSA